MNIRDSYPEDDWEPIEVERRPGGSGIAVTVYFTREEADLIIGKAEFLGERLASRLHDVAVKEAQYPWVRMKQTPPPQTTAV